MFVRLLGHVGAAVAGMVTVYVWRVPYNMHTIGRQYGARFAAVLPARSILLVVAVSAIACVACIPKLFLPKLPGALTLGLPAPLYAVLLGLLLAKARLVQVEPLWRRAVGIIRGSR